LVEVDPDQLSGRHGGRERRGKNEFRERPGAAEGHDRAGPPPGERAHQGHARVRSGVTLAQRFRFERVRAWPCALPAAFWLLTAAVVFAPLMARAATSQAHAGQESWAAVAATIGPLNLAASDAFGRMSGTA
jgi:hypothetical protein